MKVGVNNYSAYKNTKVVLIDNLLQPLAKYISAFKKIYDSQDNNEWEQELKFFRFQEGFCFHNRPYLYQLVCVFTSLLHIKMTIV